MRTTPPPISHHSLARLTVWARLWLVWFVGAWVRWWADEREAARVLDRVAYGLAGLVMLHVGARMPKVQPARHRHGRLKPARWRAMVGAHLRRALSGKDAASRLVAILTVMRDLKTHVVRQLKRLKRGLTRLRVILAAPAAAPTIARCDWSRAPKADTS